ncbi:MAG TPA: prolipoprotein diacylglyceryl transferase family protein, partial [Chloroflexota bacterium]
AAARFRGDPGARRRILDAVAPNAALGIAVGRLGAFVDGHGQGLPSDLPWATQYTNRLATSPDFGVWRHPAQVYDALLCLALFALVSRLPARLPSGSRLAAFLVVYAAGRLALGAVRLDPPFLFGLQIEQLLALVAIVFGIAYGVRPLLARRGQPRRVATTGRASARATEDSLAA